MHRLKQGETDVHNWQRRLGEAQANAARLEGEIASLEEELRMKNALIHQIRADTQGMASDMEMLTRQIVDLQQSLATCKEERDTLLKERDNLKRNLQLDSVRLQATPASPRSSLDLLESKLMRELSQATRRLQDLEKQTETTQSEKEQFASQSKSLASGLEQATEAIKYLGQKLSGGALQFPPQVHFPQAFEQVERVTDHLLKDYEEHRNMKAMLSDSVALKDSTIAEMRQERQRLESQLDQQTSALGQMQTGLAERGTEIERLQEMLCEYQRKANEAYEHEVPRLSAEVAQLKEQLTRCTADLDRSLQELSQAQQASADYRRRWEESEASACEANSASSDRMVQINQLQQARADLLKKLAASEDLVKPLNKRMEELRAQLEHAEKVKQAVEEGFSRQLKSLHAANTELKLQMAANSTGASDANARTERLNAAVEALRAEKEGLFNRLQAKENSLGSLQQELESVRSEKRALEIDMQARNEQAQRLTAELNRIKKDEQYHRKNMDGYEHLQSKVDSLTALNGFLKEQVEQKERLIKELESRLRSQSDEMRQAQNDLEQQNRRLKKREHLISNALRRLESLNGLQLAEEGGVALGALTSDLHGYQQDFGQLPQINGPDVVTPIRPSAKQSHTLSGAYPSVPTTDYASSILGRKRNEPLNKENDYLMRNLEF